MLGKSASVIPSRYFSPEAFQSIDSVNPDVKKAVAGVGA
jgi:hypothetical protein